MSIEPIYPVKLVRHVRIRMRDGVSLSAHLTMPDAEGQFPAVIEYTPYHKGNYTEPPERFRYLAERGYVCINYDVRGTGDSEGITADVYPLDEQRDGYEMVEWAAAQPWCNGNVGMWGISYCGVVCWQVAKQAPPHLKAIIVRSGTDDVYTEWTNPGGSPRPYMYENYTPLMAAYNLMPPSREGTGERREAIWRQRLEENVPWGLGFISHLTDGPYWRERSLRPDYDRVHCAVFVIGGWADWYPTPLLRAFARLNVPKRAMVGPWSHMWPEVAIPGPRIDGLRECERWFRQFLKCEDSGVLDEPPVALFIREYQKPSVMYIEDKGFFRHEDAWPPTRVCPTAYALHPGGRLDAGAAPTTEEHERLEVDPTVGVAAGKHGGGPFPPWGMPLDQRVDEARSLTYTTPEPLSDDLELIGQPQAVLCLSASADVAQVVVKLCDVAPDGTSVLVTKGYLNLTHRESHTHPLPLEPGRRYVVTVDLLACAYRFLAGHRLRVSIAGADLQNVWPTPKPCTLTLYYGGPHPSHLILPVAPPQEPPLPPPNLLPSPHPLPAPVEVPPPRYVVTHDLVAGTATVEYECQCGAGINTSRFTVSARQPARAVVESGYRYVAEEAGEQVVVETQCVTASDEAAFHQTVEAVVTVDGEPTFRKQWSVHVPREDGGA